MIKTIIVNKNKINEIKIVNEIIDIFQKYDTPPEKALKILRNLRRSIKEVFEI